MKPNPDRQAVIVGLFVALALAILTGGILTLGADSIEDGKMSVMIGFLGVGLFMILYYGLSGVVANFALAYNIVLTLAMMSAFGATLTLPGIAGIVLGVGMAVDANVLIYERIREELRNGAGVRLGIDL